VGRSLPRQGTYHAGIMNAPKPGGPTREGTASERSGSGRPLHHGVRGVVAIVFAVTSAATTGNERLAKGIAASDA